MITLSQVNANKTVTIHTNYVRVHRGWRPNFLMQSNNCAANVDEQLVPLPEDAVQQLEELGGTITYFSPFGKDPISQLGSFLM